MIRYALHCDAGHEFEAWFASSAAYDTQAGRGHVGCPECGSHRIEKSVMAPRIATAAGRGDRPEDGGAPAADDGTAALRAPAAREQALAMARKLREHVIRHSDFVGDRFAEEARRIHYKEAEPRGIYGSASDQDARELSAEGVEFHPLPALPEDRN